MENKTSSTADETIEIVSRGMGCGTGPGKYAPIIIHDGGRTTTLDELVIMAAKGAPLGWKWYRYHIMFATNAITLNGHPEDAAILVRTVAEIIEQHGPIKMTIVSGSMRGGAKAHLTGSTMLESIHINAATVAAAAKAEDDSGNDANKKSETVLVGGVSFEDVDGDTSTLHVHVSASSSSDGSSSNVLSWYAGGHCLIESVTSLKFDPGEMTLTCPQPILPTPFTNERVWNTLVAVLKPGPDTNEVLGHISRMVSETTVEVALEGFPVIGAAVSCDSEPAPNREESGSRRE